MNIVHTIGSPRRRLPTTRRRYTSARNCGRSEAVGPLGTPVAFALAGGVASLTAYSVREVVRRVSESRRHMVFVGAGLATVRTARIAPPSWSSPLHLAAGGMGKLWFLAAMVMPALMIEAPCRATGQAIRLDE